MAVKSGGADRRGRWHGGMLRFVVTVAVWAGAATEGASAQDANRTDRDPPARLAGFIRRMETGSGTYYTRANIERLRPTSFSQFLRLSFGSVRIIDQGGSLVVISRRGSRAAWDADAGRFRLD